MPNLVHLIYTSIVTPVFKESDLPDIIARSRKNNEVRGVTGILLYVAGHFFQVLEGSPDDVDFMIRKMARDPRHSRITVIIREAIPKRFFGETAMSLSELSQRELMEILHIGDAVRREEALADLDEGRAKKLLRAFSEGRWKTRLSHIGGQVNA